MAQQMQSQQELQALNEEREQIKRSARSQPSRYELGSQREAIPTASEAALNNDSERNMIMDTIPVEAIIDNNTDSANNEFNFDRRR